MAIYVNPEDGKTIVSKPEQLGTKEFSTTHDCPKCGLSVPRSVVKCPQDGTVLADTLGEGRKLVGNYEFLEFIGSGGMGVIYKARHPVLKRLVAVKMLHSHLMNDAIVRRFQQEALAVSGLSHANIISVHDFGVSEHGQPYMVMDFVEGKPLSEILRQSQLGLIPVLNIAIQLAEGLQHAHERGVLHRDLKPSNIMVTDTDCDFPEARIVDFGIAKIMETESTRVTQTGELLGTPQYMSPEQCRGIELDARSDIYALGCVMFEAITGKPVFSGESMISVIVDQISTQARSLGEVRPDIQFPIQLEDLVAKMLAKEPAERFQSMNAFLDEAIRVQKIVSQRENRKKSLWRSLKLSRDQKQILLLSLAASFTLISVASSALWFADTERERLRASPEQVFVDSNRDRVALIELISSEKIDDAFCRRFFSRNISIQELDCNSSKVTDAGMVFIGRQKELRSLLLGETRVTDAGLTYLRDLKWLKELHLQDTRVTSAGINSLIPLRNLLILSLGGNGVGNAGLEKLRALQLQHLHLWDFSITDDSMSILSRLSKLRLLRLGKCKVSSPASFERLASLPGLRALWLEDSGISDVAIPSICKIRTLSDLDITGSRVTIKGIQQLRSLPNLEHLRFRGASITQEWISTLASIPNLKRLSIEHSGITDSTLANIPSLMPNLEYLDLEECKSISDQGLLSIARDRRMFWINVKGTSVTPQGALDFQSRRSNPKSTLVY